MKIHTPYSLAAAILVVASVGVGVLQRSERERMDAPTPAVRAVPTSEERLVIAHSQPAVVEAPVATGRTLKERAQAGDPRAQWQLSDRMRRCAADLKLAERGMPSAEAEACQRDGYRADDDWATWRKKAIAAGDPIALLYDAFEAKDLAKFDAAVTVAAHSHDPDVWMVLGQLLATNDPMEGLAWMLRSCGDCTMEDPRLGFAPCVESGACASNMRFRDYLAAEYGEEKAQEAAARAASLAEIYP